MYMYVDIHTYITLHYITLHYITLHYITLHYITLHYNTYIHTQVWPSWVLFNSCVHAFAFLKWSQTTCIRWTEPQGPCTWALNCHLSECTVNWYRSLILLLLHWITVLCRGHWQNTEYQKRNIDGCHSIWSLLNDTHTLSTWHTLFGVSMALAVWLRGYLLYFVWLLFLPFWRDFEGTRYTSFSGCWVYFGILPFDSFWLFWTDPEGFDILFNSIYLEYFVFCTFSSPVNNNEGNEAVKVY